MAEGPLNEQQAIADYTRLMEAGPIIQNEERLRALIEWAHAHGKYFDHDRQTNAYRLVGGEQVIEGIFARTEEGWPIVFQTKTATHHLVKPGQRLDIWIGKDLYISGYYAPGYDENHEPTDHLWHAWPGGGYMYLAGRAENHNGEMNVRLYDQIYFIR
jgi:hypothetical protein